VDNLVDENVDKPPSNPGPAVLRLTASTSERFPGGAKPIVEDPNGDDPARAANLAGRRVGFGMSASQEGRPSMEQRIAADSADGPASVDGEPEAVDFVRFCYRRRRVGWPELYDEMCAVAGRGLYRGYSVDDLSGIGVGLTLFELPALAVIVQRVVAEDQDRRRRSLQAIRVAHAERAEEPTADAPSTVPQLPGQDEPAERGKADVGPDPQPRLVPLVAGA
jgi:hypothetical protein